MGVTHMAVCDPHGEPEGCRAIADTLARIGDKWTILVIGALSGGEPMRYNALHRRVDGISQRMLTLTLKGLEGDGLIRREQYSEIPPRVEYRLTDLGRSLLVPLTQLLEWATAHRPDMLAARERTSAA